jgi:hypothetical protein
MRQFDLVLSFNKLPLCLELSILAPRFDLLEQRQVSYPLIFAAQGKGQKFCELRVRFDDPLALTQANCNVGKFAREQVVKFTVEQGLEKVGLLLGDSDDLGAAYET